MELKAFLQISVGIKSFLRKSTYKIKEISLPTFLWKDGETCLSCELFIYIVYLAKFQFNMWFFNLSEGNPRISWGLFVSNKMAPPVDDGRTK